MATSTWERLALRAASADLAPATTIPVFLYGTAWKKDQTADLVYQALSSGFTAVDTAAQPKHYREDLVGEGMRRALRDGKIRRENLYLQTKYTSVKGQDPAAIPYDPNQSISAQVHASIKSSLRNLRISDAAPSTENETEEGEDKTYLDALVLHSPLPTMEETLEAWKACETYVPHKIRNLGISNCWLPVLTTLCNDPTVKIKPAIVQNRFFASTEFDTPLRAFCREQGIIYQSFWTLTANPDLVWSAEVGLLAQKTGISPQAALYCLVLALGNTVVLNGTKNQSRMVADLAAPRAVEKFAAEQPEAWTDILAKFKKLIGETES